MSIENKTANSLSFGVDGGLFISKVSHYEKLVGVVFLLTSCPWE
jgi:hypothetical protein